MISLVVALVLGSLVSVVVGRALRDAGRPFLDDVVRDERVAEAGARLLTVLFSLLSLGTVALVSVLDLPGWNVVHAIALKLGIVLVVIGVAHGGVLLALLSVRRRRRRRSMEERLGRSVRRTP